MGNRPKWLAQRLMQELMLEGKQIGDTLKRIEEMVSTGKHWSNQHQAVNSYEQAYAIVKLESGLGLTEEEQKAHGAGS